MSTNSLWIVLAHFVFILGSSSANCIAQVGTAPRADRSTTTSTNPHHFLFANYWASVRDISVDEKKALVFDGSSNVVVIDLMSGQIERRIPVRRGDAGQGVVPIAQISGDKSFAWTLFPDFTPIYSPAENERVKLEFEAMEAPQGQELLLDISRENIEALTSRGNGSFIVKWDLSNGEAIGELKAPGRSILAFDQKAYRSKYLATLESMQDAASDRSWLCIYDSLSLKKLAEVELPGSESEKIAPDTLDTQIAIEESRGCVIVVLKGRVCQYKLGQPLALVSSQYSPVTEYEATIDSTTRSSEIILARSISNSYTEQGPRFNDELYHFDFATRNLSSNETKVLGSFAESEFPDDSSKRLFSSKKQGQVVFSWRDQTLQGSAVVFDGANRTLSKIRSQFQLESMLSSGEYVSTVGIHDSSGKLTRAFNETFRPEMGFGSASNPPLQGRRNVASISADAALEMDKNQVTVMSLGTADIVRSYSYQELLGDSESSTGSVPFELAQGIYSSTLRAFVVAIPSPFKLTPQEKNELKRMATGSGDAAKSLTDMQMQQLGIALLGYRWTIIKLDDDGSSPMQIRHIDRSPTVKLANCKGNIALLSLSRFHSVVELILGVGTSQERKVELPTKSNATKQIATSVKAIFDFQAAIEGSDGQNRNSLIYKGMVEFPLMLLSPSRNLCLHGTETGFTYCNGLPAQNEPSGVSIAQINVEGQIVNRREISLLPLQMRAFMRLALASAGSIEDNGEVSPLSGMTSMYAPFAICFDKSQNAVFVLGQSFESMNTDITHLYSGTSNASIARTESKLALTVISVLDGKVRRKFAADWLLDEPNPESPAFEIPAGIEFDESGEFCSVLFIYPKPRTVLNHIPTQTRVLSVSGLNSIQFLNDQVSVNGAFARPSDVRKDGIKAFQSLKSPEPRRSTSSAKANDAATCYFLGIGGKTFVDTNFSSLRYSEDDVTALSELIQKQCEKDRIRYVPSLVIGDGRTSAQVGTAMFDLEQSAQYTDTVVIAVSSHGVRLNRGLYVAMPTSDLASMQATAIGWPEFVQSISRIKAKNIYVYLDVCHAGSFSEASISVLEETKKRLQAIPGLIVFASSRANEFSLELDEVKHGAFTHALLEVLRVNGALSFDPTVVASQVSLRVSELTNGKQSPQLIVANPIAEKKLLNSVVSESDTNPDEQNGKQDSHVGKVPGDKQINNGDGTVRNETKLMNGKNFIGYVSVGVTFRIQRFEKGWCLGEFDIGNRKVTGWVQSRDVLVSNQTVDLDQLSSPGDR